MSAVVSRKQGLDDVPADVLIAWVLALLAAIAAAVVVALGSAVAAAKNGSVAPGLAKLAWAFEIAGAFAVPIAMAGYLVSIRRVTLGRVGPRLAFERQLRGARRVLLWGLIWSMAGACLVEVLLCADGDWLQCATTGPALVVLAGALGLASGLTWQGLIRAVWGWPVLAAWIALAAVGIVEFHHAVQALGSVLHVAVVIAAWLAWCHLERRLGAPLSVGVGATDEPLGQWVRRTFVTPWEHWGLLSENSPSWWSLCLPHSFIWSQTIVRVGPPDKDFTGTQSLVFFGLLLFCTLCLRVPLLHWRQMLAPTGVRRSGLGRRIVLANSCVCALTACAMFALSFTFEHFRSDVSLREALDTALPLVPDAALAIPLAMSMAACVRGMTRNYWIGAAVLLGGFLLVWLASLWGQPGLPSYKNWVLWQRGVAHYAGQVCLIVAFTALAEWIWRTKDLTPYQKH